MVLLCLNWLSHRWFADESSYILLLGFCYWVLWSLWRVICMFYYISLNPEWVVTFFRIILNCLFYIGLWRKEGCNLPCCAGGLYVLENCGYFVSEFQRFQFFFFLANEKGMEGADQAWRPAPTTLFFSSFCLPLLHIDHSLTTVFLWQLTDMFWYV